MHDKSVIHRDIKLENIMFESEHPDSIIKIIDFGLSKEYSARDHILSERVGTLYSMSPETMQGVYTTRADLWSIGVCTYMLLANGTQPFEGKTPKQMVAKVLLGRYSFDGDKIWEDVSAQAKDFIRYLLVVEPQNRMDAVQARQHSWLKEFGSRERLNSAVDEEFKERVRECIFRYAEHGEFLKLALNVIAKKSTSDEIFELRSVFDDFDTNNSGTLDLAQFKAALGQSNKYSEEDIEKIFRKIVCCRAT
jgi:calcium-dependent protein kinase